MPMDLGWRVCRGGGGGGEGVASSYPVHTLTRTPHPLQDEVIQQLRQRLDTVNKEIAASEMKGCQQSEAAQLEVRELQKVVQGLQGQKQAADYQARDLQNQIEDLKRQLQEKEDLRGQSKKKVEALKAEKAAQGAQIADLKSSLAEVIDEKDSVCQELDNTQRLIRLHENEREAQQLQIKALQEQALFESTPRSSKFGASGRARASAATGSVVAERSVKFDTSRHYDFNKSLPPPELPRTSQESSFCATVPTMPLPRPPLGSVGPGAARPNPAAAMAGGPPPPGHPARPPPPPPPGPPQMQQQMVPAYAHNHRGYH